MIKEMIILYHMILRVCRINGDESNSRANAVSIGGSSRTGSHAGFSSSQA
jgi:hypothetical protein